MLRPVIPTCRARSVTPGSASFRAVDLNGKGQGVATVGSTGGSAAGTISLTGVGVTAGASAPPHLVSALVDALAGLGPTTVTESRVAEEDVVFTRPKHSPEEVS